MKCKRSLILVLLCLLVLNGSLAVTAREIIPSKASSWEEIRREVFAAVEAARGNEDKSIEAEAAILADPVTKNIILAKNADAKMYPASTTKLMSLVIALEGIAEEKFSLNDKVTISPAVARVEEGDIGLEAGEVRSLQELLLLMSVISANDAALAVAEYVGGSEQAFVAQMNSKAQELAMQNTHYMNASGLHDDAHYTTARDLLTLSMYSLEVPGLLDLTATKQCSVQLQKGSLVLSNTNYLLSWYKGTDGLKTGFTTPAGYCLAATAHQDGLGLVSVVLGCNVQYSHYAESIKLLNYGFAHYHMVAAVTAELPFDWVVLPKGKKEKVAVCAAETLTIPTAKTGDPGYEILCKPREGLKAPVKKGEEIGSVEIWAKGQKVTSTAMLAAEGVEKQNAWQAFWRFFRNIFRQIAG